MAIAFFELFLFFSFLALLSGCVYQEDAHGSGPIDIIYRNGNA
jgi:hypothetical protein